MQGSHRRNSAWREHPGHVSGAPQRTEPSCRRQIWNTNDLATPRQPRTARGRQCLRYLRYPGHGANPTGCRENRKVAIVRSQCVPPRLARTLPPLSTAVTTMALRRPPVPWADRRPRPVWIFVPVSACRQYTFRQPRQGRATGLCRPPSWRGCGDRKTMRSSGQCRDAAPEQRCCWTPQEGTAP